MTDIGLMDADCVHGTTWHQCSKCVQPSHQRGLYNMTCWNGLDNIQQDRLLRIGNLEFRYTPAGECLNPAEVEITTAWDVAPGPRFYCLSCAADYLKQVHSWHKEEEDAGQADQG